MFGSRDEYDWIDGPAFVCLVAFLQAIGTNYQIEARSGPVEWAAFVSHFTWCSRADEEGNAMGKVFAQINETGLFDVVSIQSQWAMASTMEGKCGDNGIIINKTRHGFDGRITAQESLSCLKSKPAQPGLVDIKGIDDCTMYSVPYGGVLYLVKIHSGSGQGS